MDGDESWPMATWPFRAGTADHLSVGIRIAFLGLRCAPPVEGVDRVPVSHFRGGRPLKAFLAALAVGAFALIAGASAATSAQSREHLLVGYNHAPTAADRAAIAGVGGKIRREFGSISALAVDLPSGKASDIRSQSGVSYVETDGVRTPLSLSGTLPTSQLVPSLDTGSTA